MNLSENYITTLLSLAGLLNENRIEKLRAQKVPENIINFVISFSKQTVNNPNDEKMVQQNQYIPWIASQLSSDDSLKDDARLKVVINWINKSNFPKFHSNMPFDNVYETAIKWFLSKNLDPNTLKELPIGKSEISYPDGSKWIIVKDKNFCMRVGETRGWCFSEVNKAKEFIKNQGGYMLMDKKGTIKMSVQFDKKKKELIDWQGAFNKMPDKISAMKSADLISKLGEIIKINSGHQNAINKAMEQYPDFKKFLSSLTNIKISPLDRYLLKLEVTPEQLNSIDVKDKIRHKIQLTPEELANLSHDVKLKHGFTLTDEEIKNISPIAKLAFGYKIKSSEIKLLPALMQKIIAVMKGSEAGNVFGLEDFGDSELYNGFEADSKKMELYVGDDWSDYSGLNDDDQMVFYYTDDDYAYEELQNSEEEKYMSYHMLGKENENLLKEISNFIKQPIKDEDNGIWEFIDEYISNSVNIKDAYLISIADYKANKFGDIRDKILRKEQKFKLDLQRDIITLPWTKLLRFIAEKDFKSNEIIKTFYDLKDAEINDTQGGYGLYDAWQNIWPNPKDLSYMQSEIKNHLEKDLENFQSNHDAAKNSSDADYLLSKLGFVDKDGEKKQVKMPGGGWIEVIETDINNRKFKVNIFSKKVVKSRFITFESLANYVTMPSLFENEIRKKIRKILYEGGNFEYQHKNDTATFIPPREVIQTAKKAIQAVGNNKLVQSDGSNEGSGLEKANSLSSGVAMTDAQLKRMKAFFDNNFENVKNEKNSGKNINNSSVIQKWELWGGDAGKNWVEKQIASIQSSNKTSKKIRNPEDGIKTKTLMDPHNIRIHR